MPLPVSLSIAAACAVLNLWLALRVSSGRVKGRVMLGDGPEGQLQAATRAHANFTEYAPFVLVLIVVIELSGGAPFWLWVAGAVFVAARIAHPLGMQRAAPNPLRAGGALLTWVVMALLAGWAAAIALDSIRSEPTGIDVVPVEMPRG